MAKIKFGMMMTDARGKLGGQVFSKNRAGAYVRTKVTPSNPRTSTQMASRSILGTLSASWSGLTDAQRRAWNSAVNDWQKTDIFGDSRKPTGKNLFTGLNKELLQSGQSQIALPPEKEVMPEVTISSANLLLVGEKFEIATSGDATGLKIQVSATPPMSAGTSFIDDKLRVVSYENGGSNSTLDVYGAYIAKFGVPTAGANVWVQIKLVADNGQTSVPVREKATVANS